MQSPVESPPIVAIATATGRGGIGVVRVSGKNLHTVMEGLLAKPLTPRYAHFAEFLAADGSALDHGIALYFPAPHSFTGESVLELQGHGGRAVLQLVLARCLELGCRLAEAGEFTKRAFLNGKLDLAQAESVADLIDATSEAAARSALRSLSGVFSQHVRRLVEGTIHLRMLVEASIDFPEEDIDFLAAADAMGQLTGLQAQLAETLATARQGRLLQHGLQVVLIGQPNVGKSSLLNYLSGEEVAIVTDIAGTTRDAIRQAIHLEGITLHLIDTAGLRQTQDEVEQIGIARTWQAVEQADIALLLLDSRTGLATADAAIVARLPARLPVVTLHNKADLLPNCPSNGERELWVSAKTGAGMADLKRTLLTLAGWQETGEAVFMARARHIEALQAAQQHLQQAAQAEHALEIFAEELRMAQGCFNQITGEFSADDLLGEIFSRFCIGK